MCTVNSGQLSSEYVQLTGDRLVIGLGPGVVLLGHAALLVRCFNLVVDLVI
jgi:hypothetical protein